jgi:hypothetical protein
MRATNSYALMRSANQSVEQANQRVLDMKKRKKSESLKSNTSKKGNVVNMGSVRSQSPTKYNFNDINNDENKPLFDLLDPNLYNSSVMKMLLNSGNNSNDIDKNITASVIENATVTTSPTLKRSSKKVSHKGSSKSTIISNN